MIRAALLALLLLLVACARPHVVAPRAAPRPLTFDADPVDVTVDWERSPVTAESAKIALTATDGSGVRLAAYDARAVIYGPLAFTELHLTFTNPEARMREGTFSITLPSGASVTRFAMRVGSLWQEGEVVELAKARTTFESALHRKVDPALLEQVSGNVFRGRVFPIFERDRKEIVVSYTETLDVAPYRLVLNGLPSLDTLDVQVLVPNGKKAFVLHRENEPPKHDFTLSSPGRAVRGGRFAIASVRSTAPTTPDPLESVAVLIDASASHATTYDADVKRLTRILGQLDPAPTLSIACFDQTVDPILMMYDVNKHRPGGATDFGLALEWAKGTKGNGRSPAKRVLILTDGNAAVGGTAFTNTGLERIDVIATPQADRKGTTELTRSGIRPGVVIEPDETDLDAAVKLTQSVPAPSVVFPGATHVWPSQPSTMAFVELPENVTFPGENVDSAPEEIVERAVVDAHIRELDRERTKNAKEIVALSLRHRILTPLTAMLVLENDAEYGRFQIPREAMQNIPVVGRNGVEILPRGGKPSLPPRPVSPFTGVDEGVDSDGDRIPDVLDRCPNEPETYNGSEDEDGCPDRGQVLLDATDIYILQSIAFASGSAKIGPEESVILDDVALAIAHHPELEVVGAVGHTDSTEPPALGIARGNAVRDALLKRGIAKERLIAHGFGATRPRDGRNTSESRAKNRRVEFRILVANGRPTDQEPSIKVPEFRRANGKLIPHGLPYSGEFGEVLEDITRRTIVDARNRVEAWVDKEPSNILAWIALGRIEELQNPRKANRMYGSVLDLAQTAEQRRAAAALLESVAKPFDSTYRVPLDAYARALADRPDQPGSLRLHAWALAKASFLDAAFEEILRAAKQTWDPQRFPGVSEVLRRDVGLIAAMFAQGKPAKDAAEIFRLAAMEHAIGAKEAASYAVLTWETDASDLDLVARKLGTEDLISAQNDVKDGYGPELLVLDPKAPASKRPSFEVHQISRGPAGFAMGKIALFRHDGHGNVETEDHPFVIMNQGSKVTP